MHPYFSTKILSPVLSLPSHTRAVRLVDYLLSFAEHLPSREQALPLCGWKSADLAWRPQQPSARRLGGDPEKLGGEWLRFRQFPPPGREGEELTERCREEEERGEAEELRWWWWWWWWG